MSHDNNLESAIKTDISSRPSKEWLILLRAVAVGMMITNLIPMAMILQQFIPPLAIAGVLFAVGLILTWPLPRVGAITIGLLSVIWMILNLVNYSKVIDDLLNPSMTLFFMVTIGHLLIPVGGIIGLFGVLRRASGQIAIRTLQVLGALIMVSLLFSLFV